MKFTAIVLTLTMIGAQVNALTCLPPNIAQEFNEKQKSDDVYRIFVGTLEMTGPVPKYREGKERSAKATAGGQFLNRNKLSDSRELDVMVDAICYASWCGDFPTRKTEKSIMFLRKTPQGDVLDITPCDSGYGSAASQKKIRILQRCLRRGTCSKSDIRKLQYH